MIEGLCPRCRDMFLRLLAHICAQVDLAETKVAVSDDGSPGALLTDHGHELCNIFPRRVIPHPDDVEMTAWWYRIPVAEE